MIPILTTRKLYLVCRFMSVYMAQKKSKYALEERALKDLMGKLISKKELGIRSKTFHALSEPVRLKILSALSIRPLCVCVLTELTKMKYSRLSYHLSILKRAKLVSCKEEGNWVIYSITTLGKGMTKLFKH